MQANLLKISLYSIGDKKFGVCPSCQADHPTFEVTRANGFLRGFCSACGYSLQEAVNKEIAKEAPPKKASTFGEAIVDVDSFRGLDLPEKRKIISPWLSEQTISLVAGWRGVGKTWVALAICDAITRGENFGPWETVTPAPCLYVDGEMVPQDFRERIISLTTSTPRRVPMYIYNDCHANALGLPRANLINKRWREVVKEWCISNGVKLVVFDNISSLAAGIEENSKMAWDPINQWLLDLRFAGIATILLHHTNKEGGQRGTSGREDNIDSSILLHHPYDYSAEEGVRFVLKFKKARVRNRDLSKIADTEFQLSEIEGRLVWTWTAVKGKNKVEVLRMLDEGVQQKDIAEVLRIDKGYVSRIKAQAIKDGQLTAKGNLTQSGFEVINGLVDKEI